MTKKKASEKMIDLIVGYFDFILATSYYIFISLGILFWIGIVTGIIYLAYCLL